MKAFRSALALALRPLTPGRNQTADLLRLMAAALPVYGFLLFTSYYTFPGGAWHFTAWAKTLAFGGTLPAHLAQRDVGFPLALLLSGYPYTASYLGITVMHWLMGVAMPLLVYGTVGRTHRVAAFYAGLATTASLIPMLFVKFMHHDQTYLFLTVLVVYLLVQYARSGRAADLLWFTAASVGASLTRPAGNLLYPFLLLVAFGFQPRRPVRYLLHLALFAGVLVTYQDYRRHVFSVADGQPMPSYTGKQIFYNLYMNSRDYSLQLSPDSGPALRGLAGSVEHWLEQNPIGSPGSMAWAEAQAFPKAYLDQQFTAFAGLNPREMTERMFAATNWDYFELICTAEPSDRPFLAASLEIARARPLYAVRFTLRNLMYFLFSPGYAHTRMNTNPLSPEGIHFLAGADLAGVWDAVGDTPAGTRELSYRPLDDAPRIIQKMFRLIERTWKGSYPAFVAVTAALMILAVVGVGARLARPEATLAMPRPLVPATVAAVVLLLYGAAVTCALADPSYRYHYFIIPQQVVAAACGAVVLWQLIRAGCLRLLPLRARDFLNRRVHRLRLGAGAPVIRQERMAISVLIALVALLCLSWGVFVWLHTHDAGRA